jgi:hypothetical protein
MFPKAAHAAMLAKLAGEALGEQAERLLNAGHRWFRSCARKSDQVEPGGQFMLRETEGFAEAAFPTGANHRIADLSRNDQPDARMAGVVFAAVEDQHAVGL